MSDSRAEMIEMLDALCEHSNLKLSQVALRAKLTPSTLTRYYNNPDVKHELSTPTLAKLKAAFPDFFAARGELSDESAPAAYLPIEVLPTYAGLGGGGTGDGAAGTALLPRALIEDQLHAKPVDLLLIDVRGNSMEPDFQHGDQILIDKRDRNPIQPGPFAIWDGDGYVVKNIERAPGRKGVYRIFSTNTRYSEAEYAEADIQIMGRPVWFARRL